MSYTVVYNARYGGFGMSKEALAEYNRLTSRCVDHADGIERDDPVLIQLVQTMPHTIDNENSSLKIKEFPMKYKSCLEWYDYDGKETVSIDYNQYLISTIKHVKDDARLSSDEKIARIHELYTECRINDSDSDSN